MERADQEIAFRSVVVDQTEAAVGAAVVADELLSNHGHEDFLAIEDEHLAFIHLGILLKLDGLSCSGFEIPLDLLEDGLEVTEVFAARALGDFLGRADFLP